MRKRKKICFFSRSYSTFYFLFTADTIFFKFTIQTKLFPSLHFYQLPGRSDKQTQEFYNRTVSGKAWLAKFDESPKLKGTSEGGTDWGSPQIEKAGEKFCVLVNRRMLCQERGRILEEIHLLAGWDDQFLSYRFTTIIWFKFEIGNWQNLVTTGGGWLGLSIYFCV